MILSLSDQEKARCLSLFVKSAAAFILIVLMVISSLTVRVYMDDARDPIAVPAALA